MEDKVLWIALKLFIVWLLVMASCLCICNCLFIRSDRQKSKETKLAAARASVERHKRFKRQYCDCAEDEEKLVGGGDGGGGLSVGGNGNSHHQSQVAASGLIAHSNYIQRAANPKFTIQRPSVDDVNRSQFLQQQQEQTPPIDIDTTGPHLGNSSFSSSSARKKKKCPTKISSELLLNLLRTPPSGKYLLFGREERFPRIETASNPALNIEKLPTPFRVPYTTKRQIAPPPFLPPAVVNDNNNSTDKSDDSGSGCSSSSSSSMTLPQTPAFVITDAEGLERPRSSSFSGQSSFRIPSPYRIRVAPSPSPSPSPSSLGSNSVSQHSPGLPNSASPAGGGGGGGGDNDHVIVHMDSMVLHEQEEILQAGQRHDDDGDLHPFRLGIINGTPDHASSNSSSPIQPETPSSSTSSSSSSTAAAAIRQSTVSDV